MKLKIISGGQTGVDQVGLLVAERFGLPTGGWCPKGCRTDDGAYPELVTRFGLVETESAAYPPRTIMNVRDAAATLWFGRCTSPGFGVTSAAANRLGRMFWVNKEAGELVMLIRSLVELTPQADGPLVLNVAGNRMRTHPDSAEIAARVLKDLFEQLVGEVRDVRSQV